MLHGNLYYGKVNIETITQAKALSRNCNENIINFQQMFASTSIEKLALWDSVTIPVLQKNFESFPQIWIE